jgi:hypothetical protein
MGGRSFGLVLLLLSIFGLLPGASAFAAVLLMIPRHPDASRAFRIAWVALSKPGGGESGAPAVRSLKAPPGPERWIRRIAFGPRPAKMYWRHSFEGRMKLALKIFLLPGECIANLLGATKADDRAMIRTMVDMLFWNAVVVICAAVVFL